MKIGKIDINKEYHKFIEKNPSYLKLILSYEEGEDNSIKFKLRDGRTAWYYPVIAEESYKKKKHHKKR